MCTPFNREQKTVQRCCDVIQVRFVYQTKSEILTYCTGKITFIKQFILILNELCNSIIKNCHIGTLTEGKYLEGWCFSGGDSVEWVLYKEGSAYEGGGGLIEKVFIVRVVIIMCALIWMGLNRGWGLNREGTL